MRKKVFIQDRESGTETRYIYDPAGNLLAEADSSNTIIRYYIHGLGLLAIVTPSNQTYAYHYNAIGSTVAITDQSQNMVNRYAYTPFGRLANEVETFTQPFKFVGRYGIMAESNGLFYMRARYFDAETGRFISEDPIGFAGGDLNLYAYVQNNPILFVDPSGLDTWGIGFSFTFTIFNHSSTFGAQYVWDDKGNSGITGTVGYGPGVSRNFGSTAAGVIDFSQTNAETIYQLSGAGGQTGGGIFEGLGGQLEINYSDSYVGSTSSIGWGGGGSVYTQVTGTSFLFGTGQKGNK